jgi:hypothetical protein
LKHTGALKKYRRPLPKTAHLDIYDDKINNKKCTRPYYDTAYTDGNVNSDDIHI